MQKKQDELLKAIVLCAEVTILLGVMTVMKVLDWKYYAYCLLIWMWPLMVLINRQFASVKKDKGNNNLIFSVITWLVLSIILALINLFTYDGTTIWCLFPIIGIACWPIMNFILTYIIKKP